MKRIGARGKVAEGHVVFALGAEPLGIAEFLHAIGIFREGSLRHVGHIESQADGVSIVGHTHLIAVERQMFNAVAIG